MTKQTVFYCPGCGKEAEVIQVDDQHGDIGDVDVTWKRIHLECRHNCPLLWACYDTPEECYGGILQKRVTDVTVDNRDPSATWLWISKSDYVEIKPLDLVENMVENCLPWILEETDVDEVDLMNALAVLKRATGS